MSDDFFGDLGRHISKYTKKAADSTGAFLESTKISSQISGEERMVEKLYRELGELTYRLAGQGTLSLDGDGKFKADQITAHRKRIRELKDQLAKVRGMKVCPHCGELIDSDVSFCPKCGAPIEHEPETAEPSKEDGSEESSAESVFEEEDDGAVDASFEKVDTAPEETDSADASFEEVKDEDSADAAFVTVDEEAKESTESETAEEEASMDADFTVIEDKPETGGEDKK